MRISLTLCAEPKIRNEGFIAKVRCVISLLNEGKYTPSRLSFNAILKLLDKKNLILFLAQ